jgi:histidinol-phosphate aminotransferase
VYTWEPSNATIAERYGVAVDRVLRFDTNTSPVAPGFVDAVLREPFDPPLNEYPDSAYSDLAESAAAYTGVRPHEILVGAGADEVLDLVAKAFLPAGGRAIVPSPTYGMYAVLTGQRGAEVANVPRLRTDRGFALDLAALERALDGAQLVWLCAPNNPTGADEPRETLTAVLELASRVRDEPPVVVVDEAYHEFTGATLLDLRDEYPNLVVVRTLSKAFALPGIRVGYAVAARRTIEVLERVRPPGSISTVSAALATRALRLPELALANVQRIVAERGVLVAGLRDAGLDPYPSVTNFLLVRAGNTTDAASLAERLLRAGIVPRTFGADHPLAGHIRLTVRAAPENERLLEALT